MKKVYEVKLEWAINTFDSGAVFSNYYIAESKTEAAFKAGKSVPKGAELVSVKEEEPKDTIARVDKALFELNMKDHWTTEDKAIEFELKWQKHIAEKNIIKG